MHLLDASETHSSYASIRSIVVYILSIVAVALVGVPLGLFHLHGSVGLLSSEPSVSRRSTKRATCGLLGTDSFAACTAAVATKHFYFNYEKQTIVVLGILLFYSELLRKILVRMVIEQHFRLALLTPSIYSNFYGIWALINYINDHDYTRMLRSQAFFSATELVATLYLLSRLNDSKSNEGPRLVPLSAVYHRSPAHILRHGVN